MFRIEDKTRPIVSPYIQYLQSAGKAETTDSGGKVSTYFFPSMVFPNHVAILSVTMLHKNTVSGATDKNVIMVHTPKPKPKPPGPGPIVPPTPSLPIELEEPYILKHKAGQLVTTLYFPSPVIIYANQPFYFYHKGELVDSTITISFRNL